MMPFLLHDFENHENLLPLTFTRGIGDIRVGILTISEKWAIYLKSAGGQVVPEYLQAAKYPLRFSGDVLLIRGGLLPDKNLLEAIDKLGSGQVLMAGTKWLAALGNFSTIVYERPDFSDFEAVEYRDSYSEISFPWHIFQLNGVEFQHDFEIIKNATPSAQLSQTNIVLGNGEVYLHPTAQVEGAILNTNSGNIYIGEHAEIMEGSMIRGPFALCAHSSVKMGAKIYGPTTIGPHCKVGGELNNVVIFGYSNKAHDGFLGNSVVGEWCNFGADSNNSNLKNNYSEVKLWNYPTQRFIKTGLQFCGLIMGDHSKCGINTMFNTGTVVGVSANIFGAGYPRNFIPSFSWGGAQGMKTYRIEDALVTARLVMERRGISLNAIDEGILRHIFDITEPNRKNFEGLSG
ncbi:MAG TPA: GlmU family protein [Salinivirgaceae bacterium]|nr:GlmU family protein [Salinivirgaceae bacterium]